MILTVVFLAAIILVLTAWMTVKVKDRVVKAVWVAPLWGGGALLVLTVGAGVYYASAIRTYDLCVAQAKPSIGSHLQSEQLYDTIDLATHTPHWTYDEVIPGKDSLRDALTRNLPVVDIEKACRKP